MHHPRSILACPHLVLPNPAWSYPPPLSPTHPCSPTHSVTCSCLVTPLLGCILNPTQSYLPPLDRTSHTFGLTLPLLSSPSSPRPPPITLACSSNRSIDLYLWSSKAAVSGEASGGVMHAHMCSHGVLPLGHMAGLPPHLCLFALLWLPPCGSPICA